MKNRGIFMSTTTKAIAIQIYSKAGKLNDVISIIDNELDEIVTNYMFSNAIIAHWNDPIVAIRLLRRAIKLKIADEAVYTAPASVLTNIGEYSNAIRVIDSLFEANLNWNKHVISVAINTLLLWYDRDFHPFIMDKLTKILMSIQLYDKKLITNAICQKVIHSLIQSNQSLNACNLHLNIFTNNTCKSETISLLLTSFQTLSITCPSSELEQLANKSILLINLYNSTNNIYLIKTFHYNIILKLISQSNIAINKFQIFEIFHLMKLNENKPTTFTIAEFIRISKKLDPLIATQLIHDIIVWGTKYIDLYIPLAVISDAISFIYR